MNEIYLDNSATTRTSDSAAAKAVQIMTQLYGNPSSLHSKGLEAEHELKKAREIVASSIGAAPGEIYFTSGGTEANNTAVFGAAKALCRRGKRIVTTAIEHSSVIESMQTCASKARRQTQRKARRQERQTRNECCRSFFCQKPFCMS